MWFSSVLSWPTADSPSTPARRGPSRRHGRPRPAVEALEERTAPAVFHPLAAAADGSPGSLRDAVVRANGNGRNNTLVLQAATYNLTRANTAGQENAAATGDLDLT